jgi:hypothetical protein
MVDIKHHSQQPADHIQPTHTLVTPEYTVVEKLLSVTSSQSAPDGEKGNIEEQYNVPPQTAADLITEVLHVRDDPTLNPWTFRTWFLGIGLSTFGAILATIYHFKPQVVNVSTVFLAVVSYILGEFMSVAIPRKTFMGRFLNPHPVCLLPSSIGFRR